MTQKTKRLTISILIPCHNEEKSIRKCIESCLNQTRRPDQVVVVDDGSTDSSPEIIQSFGNQVTTVRIAKATGSKSYAQEYGLIFVTGEIFIATDGDTILHKNFVKHIEESFQNPEVMAVCGYIKSLKHNWLTAVRELSYTLGQRLHKQAQSLISAIFVIPGCAGGFRTQMFRRHVRFDHDTVTEDLDFTYKLHGSNYKIAFNDQAIVYTQDPADLRSYIRQMRRWYGGGWQNLRKNFRLVKGNRGYLFELTLLYIEGFIFSVLLLASPFFGIKYFTVAMVANLVFAVGLGLYSAIVNKRLDLVIYSPAYAFLTLINAFVYLNEFISEFILNKKNMVWFRADRRVI